MQSPNHFHHEIGKLRTQRSEFSGRRRQRVGRQAGRVQLCSARFLWHNGRSHRRQRERMTSSDLSLPSLLLLLLPLLGYPNSPTKNSKDRHYALQSWPPLLAPTDRRSALRAWKPSDSLGPSALRVSCPSAGSEALIHGAIESDLARRGPLDAQTEQKRAARQRTLR